MVPGKLSYLPYFVMTLAIAESQVDVQGSCSLKHVFVFCWLISGRKVINKAVFWQLCVDACVSWLRLLKLVESVLVKARSRLLWTLSGFS